MNLTNEKKNQHEQAGTQNRAAQLSLARRGQRHRWTGHSTDRKNSNPLNTSMKIKKRYKEKGPTPEKRKSHDTHQPYGVDGPRDPVFWQWDGPTGTFWPKHVALHACSDGIARGTTHGPWAGGGESSASQSTSRLAPRTARSIAVNSPS